VGGVIWRLCRAQRPELSRTVGEVAGAIITPVPVSCRPCGVPIRNTRSVIPYLISAHWFPLVVPKDRPNRNRPPFFCLPSREATTGISHERKSVVSSTTRRRTSRSDDRRFHAPDSRHSYHSRAPLVYFLPPLRGSGIGVGGVSPGLHPGLMHAAPSGLRSAIRHPPPAARNRIAASSPVQPSSAKTVLRKNRPPLK
jgi:hypothetical protein